MVFISYYSFLVYSYFMKKIDTGYLLSNLSSLTGLPVSAYQKGQRQSAYGQRRFPLDPASLALRECLESKESIGYRYDAFGNYYVFLRNGTEVYVLGPSRDVAMTENEQRRFALALGVKSSQWGDFRSSLNSLTRMPLSTLLLSCMSLYHVFTGEKATFEELFPSFAHKEPSDAPVFEEPIQDVSHLSGYEAEQKIISFIRHGNREGLEAWVSSIPSIRAGETSESVERQNKNLFVATATLASRAAIEGGLDIETSLSLCDSYLRRGEPLGSSEALFTLQYQMLLDYANRVRKLGDGGSLSKAVGSYVEAHLGDPIRLKDIASSLSLSVSALCAKFKKETGQSVVSFATKLKVEEAKEQLLETDRAMGDIAFYLGFSSPAHFSKVFSETVGLSPKKFRKEGRDSNKEKATRVE